MSDIDYDRFYERLFAPLVATEGPEDPNTISAIVGFSAGGPVSVSCFRRAQNDPFVTYATCELTQYLEQGIEASAPFELVLTTDSEDLAISLLTALGALSLETSLGHHHTVDVSTVIPSGSTVAGLVLEELAAVDIEGEPYALLRCIGLSEGELSAAQREGAEYVIGRLKVSGIYPRTPIQRETVV